MKNIEYVEISVLVLKNIFKNKNKIVFHKLIFFLQSIRIYTFERGFIKVGGGCVVEFQDKIP